MLRQTSGVARRKHCHANPTTVSDPTGVGSPAGSIPRCTFSVFTLMRSTASSRTGRARWTVIARCSNLHEPIFRSQRCASRSSGRRYWPGGRRSARQRANVIRARTGHWMPPFRPPKASRHERHRSVRHIRTPKHDGAGQHTVVCRTRPPLFGHCPHDIQTGPRVACGTRRIWSINRVAEGMTTNCP